MIVIDQSTTLRTLRGPGAPTRRAFLGTAGAVVGGAVAAATVGSPRAMARPRPRFADLALTSATIVDPASERVRRGCTVLVRGDLIVAVGRSGAVPVRDAARVVDLRGAYLLPGLCDMHVHTSYEDIDLPLHIANGVTTVREMWGHPWVHEWRNRIEAGSLLGPRYVIGSQIIDGSPTLWNDPQARPSAPIVAATPDQGRAAVRSEVAAGCDFVKIYSRVPAPVFAAIADECKRAGVRFGGHCPDDVPAECAAEAGMWSFEHLDGLWWSTSSRERELRHAIARIRIDPGNAYDSWFARIGALEWIAANSYDRRRADQLFERLRRSGSWQVPTLTLNHRIDVPDGSRDPRMKYVPSGDAEFWKLFVAGLQATRTPAQERQHEILFRRRERLVGAMAAAGVPLLAGTDLGTTYQFPGFSLHDEFAFLVDAGLSPMHVLRCATSEPARALGRSAVAGSVRAGHVADLVVLRADPLADIRNSRTIAAVVVRGQLVDAAARARLLADAGRAAAGNSPGVDTAPRRRTPGCGCAAHSVR